MEYDVDNFKVVFKVMEDGKDYTVYALFVEMPETQHHGFLMKRGDKIIAKGEVAKYLRDLKVKGLEMAAAPPADTNAVVVFRVSKDYDVLETVARNVIEFLKSKEFL